MAGMLVLVGLFLLWGAATGRADALVTAVMNPSGLTGGTGGPGGTPTDPNALPPATDPGGTELAPYWGGHVPYYPPSPSDPQGVPGPYQGPNDLNPWDWNSPNQLPLAPGWYTPQ